MTNVKEYSIWIWRWAHRHSCREPELNDDPMADPEGSIRPRSIRYFQWALAQELGVASFMSWRLNHRRSYAKLFKLLQHFTPDQRLCARPHYVSGPPVFTKIEASEIAVYYREPCLVQWKDVTFQRIFQRNLYYENSVLSSCQNLSRRLFRAYTRLWISFNI